MDFEAVTENAWGVFFTDASDLFLVYTDSFMGLHFLISVAKVLL